MSDSVDDREELTISDVYEAKQILSKVLYLLQSGLKRASISTKLEFQIKEFINGKTRVKIGENYYSMDELVDTIFYQEE